jgi:hypothetical protein
MRSVMVAGLVSLLLSSFAWAQSEVTFDFEDLPLGDIPPEGVVMARTLTGDPLPGYVPGDPANEFLPDHIAIRVSRPNSTARIDEIALVPGRPASWGSRTLSPFADPLNTSKMVIEILHVPVGQGVEIIEWEMGDFIPSDVDEYLFQTFVDPPVVPESIVGGGLQPPVPPDVDFFSYPGYVQRDHAINKFEVIGGSTFPLPEFPPFPHSVYYDNFAFTISPVDPTNAFVAGTDVPASDFGGGLLSFGLDGDGGDPYHRPTADAGSDAVYECGTDIVLSGSVVDPDGGDLTYEWVLLGPGGGETTRYSHVITVEADKTTSLPLLKVPSADHGVGTHTIELRVTDETMLEGTDTVDVTVQDTIAPTLVPVSSHCRLWPANHKMVTVTIEAHAWDACCAAPTLSASVSSDEPVDGTGDGGFSPDWTEPVIQANGVITLDLRAERSGKGDGRTYSVLITAADCSNNQTSVCVEVFVPHDLGKKGKK